MSCKRPPEASDVFGEEVGLVTLLGSVSVVLHVVEVAHEGFVVRLFGAEELGSSIQLSRHPLRLLVRKLEQTFGLINLFRRLSIYGYRDWNCAPKLLILAFNVASPP